MNKKIFVIVLIVCLTFGMAFAAKKADIKVGAQLGYGNKMFKTSSKDLDASLKVTNGGFLFAVNGEYGITDEISVKAELGMNTMGKGTVTQEVAGYTLTQTDTENAGISFVMYVGGQYAFEITKEISVKVGAGLDMISGLFISEEESKNTGIGLGFEVAGDYAIDKNITATVGAKFGWHFINTNEEMSPTDDFKKTSTALQIFAGATYAL